MASFYLDTSALAKRYLPEIGSEWVRDLCLSEDITVSSLSLTELASTLGRMMREGRLGTTEANGIYRQFLADTSDYVVVGLTGVVVDDAASLLLTNWSTHPLRSLDALHLASARVFFARVQQQYDEGLKFVTSDRQLARAAAALGLVVLNPEER